MVVEVDEPLVSQSLLNMIVLYQKLDQDKIKRFEYILLLKLNLSFENSLLCIGSQFS